MKKPEFLPEAPGVYLFKDKNDNIIYVGKARSIKKRVSQYFQKTDLDVKTTALVKNISDLEYMVTPTEVDALILESNLIKEHRPRYNVNLKDDKQYPYIKITVNEDYPRIFLTRKRLQDGAKYLGPYINAGAVRETLKLISKIFKIRRCKKNITGGGRPCLNFQIGLCSAPCSGASDKETYRASVDAAVQFLEGKSDELVKLLEKRMQYLASSNKFEDAAAVRDQVQAVKTVSIRQRVTGGFDDWDAVAVASSAAFSCVQILYVREGALVGKGEFTLDSKDASKSEIMGAFLKHYYSEAPIPGEILLNIMPDDPAILLWLEKITSGKVNITVPARGRKKELVDMALENAHSLIKISILKEQRREKSGRDALMELKDKLGLEGLPQHIEAFDISNIGGTSAVGSMVVFRDGLPDRRSYRHFNIRTVEGISDTAMMEEVVSRHAARVAREEQSKPDLIMVDGGPAQVSAALKGLRSWKLAVPVIGLAKQFEHIYLPGIEAPLVLPRSSPALIMLRQIRDESHRFAVSHHRRRRSAQLRSSVLDTIPGIGKKRKEKLLRHFGSLDGIKAASLEELENVSGISRGIARDVYDKFHGSKSL